MLGRLIESRFETRDLSYQDVWGRGDDWSPDDARAYSGIDAMALSAVVGCVRLRSNLISQLPFNAYIDDTSGNPMRVPSKLVDAPSLTSVRSVWLGQLSISRDLWGNAFGLILAMDAAGYPTKVEWAPPDKVQTHQDTYGGPLRFRFGGQPYPTEKMLVVPSMALPGSPVGIPPLQRAGLVDIGRKAQQFGRDWFHNGAVPSSILYSDRELTSDQAEQIRGGITSAWRKRRPAVLGAGLKYEQIKADEKGSQFLETMRHVQVDVCQVFGVPPESIGIGVSGQSITYSNREQQMSNLMVTSLNADIVTIQEVLTAHTPTPQYVRATTAALLRSDTATRFATYEAAARIEQITGEPVLLTAEMRRLEELPTLPSSQHGDDLASARELAELIQKIYLGVGKVLTADEAREIANRAGAGFDLPGPFQPGDTTTEDT